MFYVLERQNYHIGMSCVLARNEYLAWEHSTATACSNIDILGFTPVFPGLLTPVFCRLFFNDNFIRKERTSDSLNEELPVKMVREKFQRK